MNIAVICILVKGNPVEEILLGYKKEGFGEGKYVGLGGKIENGETPEAAAMRELAEETGVRITAQELEESAHLTFLFPAKPEWNHQVTAFLVRTWQGRPQESHEIRPRWFKVDEIPYKQMWADGRHWLPPALNGEKVAGRFIYNENNHSLREVELETGAAF